MDRSILRDVDPILLDALRRRAALHGRNVEDEHRAILTATLGRAVRPSLARLLPTMPAVGRDADFARA